MQMHLYAENQQWRTVIKAHLATSCVVTDFDTVSEKVFAKADRIIYVGHPARLDQDLKAYQPTQPMLFLSTEIGWMDGSFRFFDWFKMHSSFTVTCEPMYPLAKKIKNNPSPKEKEQWVLQHVTAFINGASA